MNSRLEQLR